MASQTRIGFVTVWDHRDTNAYSGTAYWMWNALRSVGSELYFIDDLRQPLWHLAWQRSKQIKYRYLYGKAFNRCMDNGLARLYAEQAYQKLMDISITTKLDIIVAPGAIPVAFLPGDIPVLTWADAHFSVMVDYYLYNLCSESLRDGLNLEQSCLQRSSASIFTSEWAAEAAKSNALCEDDSAKVHVVPYGANILCQRTETDIDAIIRSRQTKECNLLFIGKDLKRKNAAFAVQVVAEINRLGLASTLTIIGSSEQADIDYLPYVQSLGFIDKHSPHGMRLINEAFARSHFLIMPSRADCTPMVLAEANSFGLPCLAARTGGIPSVIHEGQNGYLFDTNASPASVAALVVDIFADYQHYFTLAKQSFREYQSRLNWSVSAGKVTSIVYNVLNQS